ncbi:MAG: insulinase family protein, partial [Chlamydiae bacterium]|nr:insulinase family protein [Chlamydiota bacterium]
MKQLLALFLSASLFAAEVEDCSNLKIETPSMQDREHKKLRLDNGLEAILISDPQTPSSGAALAVSVGTWDDPQLRPGMAHFVEHLLFLGTKKYPQEEGYTRYLDEHGGTRNAFTMSDRTCYMFSVNNDGFSQALDRFGHFFIEPLFSESGIARECNAIHQEYCSYKPLDNWRTLYIKKELANPDHPFHAFCIGSLESLDKIPHSEVRSWYEEHYSSDRMHLVVISDKPMDQLQSEVEAIFSQVKRKDSIQDFVTASLFTEEAKGTLAAIYPVQEVQQLEIAWEIPRSFGQDMQHQVPKLVAHVLGHEGEGSLLSTLKKEELAEALGVGSHHAG